MRLLPILLVSCGTTDLGAPEPIKIDTEALAALSKPVVTGKIRSEGGELGTWEVAPSDCQSGQYRGFFGVDILVAGSTRSRLRYVHDEAAGEVVKIFYPDKKDTAMVFRRTDGCAVLEGSVTKMNVRTRVSGQGDIQHLEGRVKYDCTADGTHVSGEVTFSHCH